MYFCIFKVCISAFLNYVFAYCFLVFASELLYYKTMGLSFSWMFEDTEPSGKELLVGMDYDASYSQVSRFPLIAFAM